MTRDDVGRCRDVFFASIEELHDRLGQPRMPRNPTGLERQYQHLLSTDPGHAWLAEDAGTVVGFGMANRRGRSWFLSFLFVLREHQGAGLGRRILLRCLPEEVATGDVRSASGDGRSAGEGRSGDGRSAGEGRSGEGRSGEGRSGGDAVALAACAESFQPVSTALYARFGMLPRLPFYLMVGRPKAGALPALPADVTAVPFEGADGPAATNPDAARHASPVDGLTGVPEAVPRLDRELLAYERPDDHRSWRDAGRQGILFVRSGDAVGYGYVHPGGRVGPVAVLDADLMPAVLGHLVALTDPEGACQFVVPGTSGSALVGLLAAGLRIDGAPAVYCATWPGPPFERYLPNSFALL